MSVIFDDKIFGSNFGSGTLAVTVLGYRNGNFEETDTVFNKAISWDSYRGPLKFGRMPMPQDDLTIMRLAGHGYPIIVSPIPPSCHPLFAPAISPG